MDLISVYPSGLPEVLKAIKDQAIMVKLCNRSGHWSEQFFTIDEIKELTHGKSRMTILILFNSGGSESTVIDIQSISAVELQRPYFYDGRAYARIKIVKESIA